MTQLLQARGWYGVFLRAEPIDAVVETDEEGVSAKGCVRLSLQLRPLVGWTSAEGGFRGLYYNEARGTLSTHLVITTDHPGQFIGDVCEDETPTIRGLLLKNVFDNGTDFIKAYMNEYRTELADSVREFLENRRLPLKLLSTST